MSFCDRLECDFIFSLFYSIINIICSFYKICFTFYFLLADKPLAASCHLWKNAIMYDVGSSVETLSPWAIISVTVKCKRVVVNSLRVMHQKHSETMRMCKLVCSLQSFHAV